MKHPVFNFICKRADRKPYSGELMSVYDIEKMPVTNDVLLDNFLQCCDCGYRMCSDNANYDYWNNCICEDIDYKVYIEKHEENYIDPDIVYNNVWNYMCTNFKHYIYYGEKSRSKKGFHFIFYFNVSRTKESRLTCKAVANYIIHKSFIDCGYEDIISYEKVYDYCMDSFYQGVFITKYDYKINKECDGVGTSDFINYNYFTIKNIYDKLLSKLIKREKKKDLTLINDDWDLNINIDDNKEYYGDYLNHHQRWYVYKSLSGLCKSDEELEQEWERCAKMFPEGNGHNTNFYINEPKRNHWDKYINEKEYIDTELLKDFGYDIKFMNNKKHEDNIKKSTKAITKEKVYM